MPVFEKPPLTSAELSQLLETVDPAALLVAPRLLRRIIKHDRKLTHLGLQVPHRKSYVIGKEALLGLASLDELSVEPRRLLPATLLLLYGPDPEKLAAGSRDGFLVKYWRLLFHARVHEDLARRFQENRVTDAAIRQRIHHIGQTEFDEVRTVLRQEKLLLPPQDDRTVYEEFAALYLELSFFAAPLLPRYFPAIEDFERINQILAQDVDAAALYASTRLPEAPDPVFPADNSEQGEMPRPTGNVTLIWSGSDQEYQSLVAGADQAAAAGNMVRAAIRRSQAARVAPPVLVLEAQEKAQAEVGRLVQRLQKPLHLADAELETWRQALAGLLSQAVEGIWPAEARLLYDLQKICVDHERPLYAPDLVEWAYSFFQRPLLRPLPDQPLVLAVKHLRVAVNRLPAVRVTDSHRQELSRLLHGALHHAEDHLRDCFRPPIGEALSRVGLQPQNLPERLGRAKLIEELLDRITERGFLNMSDLRDALARNQLKLPDLSGPGEFLTGDPLLRANRELAVDAAGVYRRGEIYMRWLQRGSALAFGTRPGRWLMLFMVFPFLGAFAGLVFVQEMLNLCQLPHHIETRWDRAPEPEPEEIPADHPQPKHGSIRVTVGDWLAIGALTFFNLLLIHLPVFRRLVLSGLRAGWQALRLVLWDLPVAFLRLSALRRFLQSRPYLLLVRFFLKPLPVAVLTWAVLGHLQVAPDTSAWGSAAAFLAVGLFLNSRFGRDFEEAFFDGAMRNWEYLQGLLPGLFRLFMNLFKTILEAMDRFFYTVDEWLRFHAGETRLSLVMKTILGFLWFLITYVIRLYVNVFIEPTFNPIKHFPAVTVTAKLLVPFWGVLLGFHPGNPGLLAAPFLFLGPWLAYGVAFIILHSLPGAAGFLVWEFKENWRLYRANRSRTLRPEIIGHHGETMLRLMKPGFHSGTLPKLYAKLRRAERRAYRKGTWQTVRRLREALHHVEESIRHFTERELLAFIRASKGWTAGPIELVTVAAGSNRIRLELVCSSLNVVKSKSGQDNLELHFEEQSGWLLARIARSGWLPLLAEEQAAVLTTALLGFYQKAGVDLVHEQIEASFGVPCPPYDIGDEGLIVWPGHGYDTEVIYDLYEEPVLHPHVREGQAPEKLPTLAPDQLLFRSTPITWEAWVDAWERDQAGAGDLLRVLPQVRVFPSA